MIISRSWIRKSVLEVRAFLEISENNFFRPSGEWIKFALYFLMKMEFMMDAMTRKIIL